MLKEIEPKKVLLDNPKSGARLPLGIRKALLQKLDALPQFGAFSKVLHEATAGWLLLQRSRETCKAHISGLKILLNYIDEREPDLGLRLRSDYKSVSVEMWGDGSVRLRNSIAEDQTLAARTRDSYISKVRLVLKQLQDSGLIPRLNETYKLRGVRNKSGLRSTTFETTGGQIKSTDPTAIGDEAREQLTRVISQCEQIIREAEQRLDRGEELIACCDLPADQLIEELESCRKWRDLRMFCGGRPGLPRLLTYIHAKFGGVVPSGISDLSPVGWAFVGEHPGVPERHLVAEIVGYFALTPRELSAAAIVIAVEAYANPEDIRRLTVQSLKKSDGRGNFTINLDKWRSGSDREGEIDVNEPHSEYPISVPEVFRLLSRHASPLSRVASELDRDLLFLNSFRSGARSLADGSAAALASSTISRHVRSIGEGLGYTGLNLQALREISATQLALEPAGSTLAMQAAMRHKSHQTTRRYAEQLAIYNKAAESILAFLEELQFIATLGDRDRLEALGVSPSRYLEAKTRSENFAHKVFKVFAGDVGVGGGGCADPLSGAQAASGFSKGSQCGALDKCFECENFLPVVVATPENICFILSFEAHLLSSEKAMVQRNPVRWSSVWLPWLVFSQIARQQLDRPIHLKALDEGSELFKKRPVVFPELW